MDRQADTISDAAGLRQVYAEPSELVQRKKLDRLDPHCRNFIAHAPFVVLATSGADGSVDASPRGDAPGFVQVVDERTLLIPDRRGNNLLDSMGNILGTGEVGLLFLVPGIGETLRVNGTARIVADPALLEAMAVDGKPPSAAIEVTVREAFLHCAKAMIRSRLWQEDYRVGRETIPTLGKMIADQLKGGKEVAETEAWIEDGYRTRLY
jgi:PPOX class probable FMN-dependent enzyme